jgi:DNA polymerase elongation subunit (family B)
MPFENNKLIVRRYIEEVINTGKIDEIEKYIQRIIRKFLKVKALSLVLMEPKNISGELEIHIRISI